MEIKDTYMLMQEFLEQYADKSFDLTVGELLGSLAVAEDGKSMDPLAWDLWKKLYAEKSSSQKA